VQETLANLRQGTTQVDLFNPKRLLEFRRIAATRLDLLAHSMGGLATRFYLGRAEEFRRPSNYFFGDLRRIITVGTPYKGAAIARWVWRAWLPEGNDSGLPEGYYLRSDLDPIRQAAKNLPGVHGDMLAYRDMDPESEVLRSFEDVRETDPTVLMGPRVHTIVVYADNAGVTPETLLWVPKFLLLEGKPLEPDLSDRVVCVQSQRGANLDSHASSELRGITHTQEGASVGLRQEVLVLLNQGDGDEKFDGSGMPPSKGVPKIPLEFTCMQP